MKIKTWIWCVAFFFALTTLSFAQETITFDTKYQKGEVFRYQYKSTSTVHFTGTKQQPKVDEIELVFKYTVLNTVGKDALVVFEIEKMASKSNPADFSKINDVLKSLKLKFLMGPGLNMKRIYGLENFVNPLLQKLPLNPAQKKMVKDLIKRLMTPLNQGIEKANAGNRKIFQGSHKEGERHNTKTNMRGIISSSGQYTLKKISKEKDGSKLALFEVKGKTAYGWVFKIFGNRSSSMTGEVTVNERGLVEKFSMQTKQDVQFPKIFSLIRKSGVKAMKVHSKGELVLLKEEKKSDPVK